MAIERFEIDTDTHVVVPRVPHGMQMQLTAFNLCARFGLEFVQAQEQFVRAVYDQMIRNAPRPEAGPKCLTCNDHGMIGGPSYYQPDEGGEPCPDCTPKTKPRPVPTDIDMDRMMYAYGLLPDDVKRKLSLDSLAELRKALNLTFIPTPDAGVRPAEPTARPVPTSEQERQRYYRHLNQNLRNAGLQTAKPAEPDGGAV